MPNHRHLKKLFGSMQRLRHFMHLLPAGLEKSMREEMSREGVEQPTMLAAAAEVVDLPTPATFAEALRAQRLREGLDQDELGELIGVTGQAVSAWEMSTNTPIVDHFEKLVALFPTLADRPPARMRDMEKPNPPGRPAGIENAPMANNQPQVYRGGVGGNSAGSAGPAFASTAAPPPPIKGALIRWGRLVHALKSAPNATQFIAMLDEAENSGMTVRELREALSDP